MTHPVQPQPGIDHLARDAHGSHLEWARRNANRPSAGQRLVEPSMTRRRTPCRASSPAMVSPTGPAPGIMGPMVGVELQRIEALELLGMTLAHLNDAEARGEVSPRVPLLMAIRDKLALALREES